MRRRVRAFSFSVLVLLFLHVLGASGQMVNNDMVAWPVGPCEFERHLGQTDMTVACDGRQLLQFWPFALLPVDPGSVQAAAR